jgi:hypothetical protein
MHGSTPPRAQILVEDRPNRSVRRPPAGPLLVLTVIAIALTAWLAVPTLVSAAAGVDHELPRASLVHALNGSPNGSSGNSTEWSAIAPPSSPPGTAAGAAFAFDPVDGYDVLFGGCTAGNFWYSACSPTNATWTYQNGTWTQLTPGVSPPARFYSSMVWNGSAVILFGGNTTTSFLNDTWSFLHGAWTELYPTVSPAARAGASLAYDAATNSTILFGGEMYRTLTNLSTETYAGQDFGDTWSFAAGQWTQLHPTTSPGARDSASMAYYPQAQEVVLFGGFNWTIYNTDDTWAFDGGNWTQLTPSQVPDARNNGALAYDPALQGLLLFGGHQGRSFYDDSWEWNASGWHQLGAGTSVPPSRWAASLAPYGASCVILFGGFTASSYDAAIGSYFNDTWSLGSGCTAGGGSGGGNSSGSGNGSSGGNNTGSGSGSGNSSGNGTGSGNSGGSSSNGNGTGQGTGGAGGAAGAGAGSGPGTGSNAGTGSGSNSGASTSPSSPSTSAAPSSPGKPVSLENGAGATEAPVAAALLLAIVGAGLGILALRRRGANE